MTEMLTIRNVQFSEDEVDLIMQKLSKIAHEHRLERDIDMVQLVGAIAGYTLLAHTAEGSSDYELGVTALTGAFMFGMGQATGSFPLNPDEGATLQ